jgi:hypothetical protein
MKTAGLGAAGLLIDRSRFLLLGLTLALASPAHATSVKWTGPSSFDVAFILFPTITADQLTSITGPGQYEGCCGPIHLPHGVTIPAVQTNFSLFLHEGPGLSGWVDVLDWHYTPDNTPVPLSGLPGLPVPLGDQQQIDGIALTSLPFGVPLGNDPNFTHLITTTTVCSNYNGYDSRWGDDDDRNCTKIKNHTVFNFDCTTCATTGSANLPATPLPAAAWLFGSVIAGGVGLGRWRRKRRAKNTAV